MSNQIQVQQVEADALPRLPNESQSSLKQPNDKDIQSTKNPTKMEKFKAKAKIGKDFLVVHITRHWHFYSPNRMKGKPTFLRKWNWSVDLQAGSQYGYKLLSIVLLAGLGAILLQTMAARLGCVTGRGKLASSPQIGSRTDGRRFGSTLSVIITLTAKAQALVSARIVVPDTLPRYVNVHVVVAALFIMIDLLCAMLQLLGSAIGLSLLVPAIPFNGTNIIRAASTRLRVVTDDLVLIVFVVFIILIRKIDPYWPDVFNGYLPSKTIFQPGALYTSIGILGATVMPHALFLGSSLATLDRVSHPPVVAATLPLDDRSGTIRFGNRSRWPAGQPSQGSPQFAARASDVNLNHEENKVEPQTQAHASPGRQNNSFNFIKAHLNHAIVDIVMSLLGFAVSINSAILILGAAAFYYGGDGQILDAGLFDAHDLIRDKIGRPAAFLFALALLCSGQSASITATLAGQIVSEGFIEWRISVAFGATDYHSVDWSSPSMVVAIAVGRQGIDALLVASQVALSIVLPFVIFPLVYLASSDAVMSVPTPDGGTKSYKNHG
ncbi:hypothetical protein RhiXN_01774 [Rhizoctonia solani]|uniref:Uncharacterized protein n=1 Tax=Rhizoctonia solani TaxID=456999 RepID=A0A8H8T2S4_9AGAM|nr:uncharacterized protein RhiXN_01774 [Rhizoctonia solani]QRW27179.1 hypothetical protein RhiXN_01774 [Rhizoctonia solani]